ncbi:MAG: hypothetical protein K0Q46_3890 [Rhodococcus erythropolis]|jgi:hypothetical protein|nr:hypothetical protein [Rhodococcus erythropolis]MDF2897104.1 hypothetical protein [Rhodococcus erythropolis]OQM77850.1 hypothetical protein B0E55_06258 [Rhodococcus sp. 66b]
MDNLAASHSGALISSLCWLSDGLLVGSNQRPYCGQEEPMLLSDAA